MTRERGKCVRNSTRDQDVSATIDVSTHLAACWFQLVQQKLDQSRLATSVGAEECAAGFLGENKIHIGQERLLFLFFISPVACGFLQVSKVLWNAAVDRRLRFSIVATRRLWRFRVPAVGFGNTLWFLLQFMATSDPYGKQQNQKLRQQNCNALKSKIGHRHYRPFKVSRGWECQDGFLLFLHCLNVLDLMCTTVHQRNRFSKK